MRSLLSANPTTQSYRLPQPASQIERLKLTADLTNKIPKMRENLDAVASTAQRATDAANAAGIAITVIEDDRKRAAAAGSLAGDRCTIARRQHPLPCHAKVVSTLSLHPLVK